MSDQKDQRAVNEELRKAVRQGAVDAVCRLLNGMADPNHRFDPSVRRFEEESCRARNNGRTWDIYRPTSLFVQPLVIRPDISVRTNLPGLRLITSRLGMNCTCKLTPTHIPSCCNRYKYHTTADSKPCVSKPGVCCMRNVHKYHSTGVISCQVPLDYVVAKSCLSRTGYSYKT